MEKKLFWLIVLLLNGFGFIKAQENQFKVCGTTEMVEKEMMRDPSYQALRSQLEEFTRSYLQSSEIPESESGLPIYTIPVVFHVMHDYGAENISKAQIEDAMLILNQSFQKLNDDTGDVIPAFQSIFADCQVEFRLAQIDPAGNCSDGITRHYTELTYGAGDNVKPLAYWPSNKYFNIYVVNSIGSGAAGYAYYPGAQAGIDGVVIRHDYVGGIGTSNGSNYTERSLTHEVGHYLNLMHTWGNSNTPGLPSNCNLSDQVSDTPATVGVANFSCNTSQSTCSFLDNVQNYMDYAGCHKMFTSGQKSRMHSALNSPVGSRNNLWQIPNLVATGTNNGFVPPPCTPVADFSNKSYMICTGDAISFTDASWNNTPTSWSWAFAGGTPSVSTAQNPVVTYNTPGIYDVTLTVSNAAGSNSLTRTGIVVVSPATANYAVPYSESFESFTSFPPSSNEWFVSNTTGTNAWDLTSAAAFTGTQSVRLYNFIGNGNGNIDEFITPSYDFSNITNGSLTFQLAFAHRSSSTTDKLRIFASKDCGQTWNLRYVKTGAALSTAGLISTDFIPTSSSQWRLETVSMATATYNNQPNIRFKFEYTQNTGNNIYVDDLFLNGVVGINESNVDAFGLEVTPNPSVGSTMVSFTIDNPEWLSIKLFDVLGKEWQTIANQKFNSGDYSFVINAPSSSGLYFLKIQGNSSVTTRKIVFSE